MPEVSIAAPGPALVGGHPILLPSPAAKPKLVAVVGGPGSGKVTLCERLVDELHAEYGVVHFSIGDLLRHAVTEGDEHSEEIEAVMIKGEPVRDEIVMKVMLASLPIGLFT